MKSKKPQNKVRVTLESLGFLGSPATRVIGNKKGKGSYRRKDKHGRKEDN